ncbi:MAG: M48 family metallopeptidase [Rivularia sp. (in: cyanobacteria)]
MNSWKTKFLTISSFCLLLFSATLPVQAKPTPASIKTFESAKKELPKDWYVFYRIVDRIARANAYDQRPWRIVVVPKYDINAFATDVNLIAMYGGIIDQLNGDSSALACIVAHEMGHHKKRHIAIGQAKKAELTTKIQQEAEIEVLGEKRAATTESTATGVAGTVVQRTVGGPVGNVLGGLLGNQSQRRVRKAQKRINAIVEKKNQDLEQRIAAQSRQHEFEADEIGYLASVRAGFEPEGCLRAMEVLARTPGAEFDTSHPAVPKRIEALKALIQKYPSETLKREGEVRMGKSQALTYSLSRDGKSLRINSIRGGSASDDIDRMFDK